MTGQDSYDEESTTGGSTLARFAHLFPWEQFSDRVLGGPQLFELLRPNKEHSTLRDMKPIWFSAAALRNIAPPGEIVISLEEELKIKVVGEVRDYMSTNWEGFVESDLVFDESIPEALFKALHFVWLDRDPRVDCPPPPVSYIAELYERFSAPKSTQEPQ